MAETFHLAGPYVGGSALKSPLPRPRPPLLPLAGSGGEALLRCPSQDQDLAGLLRCSSQDQDPAGLLCCSSQDRPLPAQVTLCGPLCFGATCRTQSNAASSTNKLFHRTVCAVRTVFTDVKTNFMKVPTSISKLSEASLSEKEWRRNYWLKRGCQQVLLEMGANKFSSVDGNRNKTQRLKRGHEEKNIGDAMEKTEVVIQQLIQGESPEVYDKEKTEHRDNLSVVDLNQPIQGEPPEGADKEKSESVGNRFVPNVEQLRK